MSGRLEKFTEFFEYARNIGEKCGLVFPAVRPVPDAERFIFLLSMVLAMLVMDVAPGCNVA